MIVSKETQDAIMELIKQCFQMNRFLDRGVSVLGSQYACNNASKYIHQGIAHYFPQLSDKIGELTLERYNIPIIYGETPKGDEQYASVTSLINEMEKRIIDFQTLFMGVCKIALDHNDIHVYTDLLDLLEDYNKVVEQIILIKDKMNNYGEDKLMSFDHDFFGFWILGENK